MPDKFDKEEKGENLGVSRVVYTLSMQTAREKKRGGGQERKKEGKSFSTYSIVSICRRQQRLVTIVHHQI